ncbi:MAG: DUF5017 domain-containing protein [Bacteroidota bacterium]
MKIVKTALFIGAITWAAACSKKMDVDMPSLSVSLDTSKLAGDTFVYKLGDTTKFLFSGTADNIVFYSGEAGKRYEFRNRVSALGVPTLSFTSSANFGAQLNTLQVLATTKLPGYDSASIVNATWTDITSRALLATSVTTVNSGNIKLNDVIKNESDSLVIAFKYNGTTGSTQRTWIITNYTVNNVLPDQIYNLASIANDATTWKVVTNVPSPANARWVPGTANLTIVGGAATAPSNTGWIVSKPIFASRVADYGLGVKSINNPIPALLDLRPGYAYKYGLGTYKASIVSFNATAKNQETAVKEFWVKVIP